MNYYQYKRRVPETKKGSDYIKPFIALVIFIAVIIAAWKLLTALFGGSENDPIETTKEKVAVRIETGSAKVMASGASQLETIPPSGIDIYEEEKVETLSDGRVTLDFFDGTVARLDKSSSLMVDNLTDDTTDQIDATLEDGQIWVDMTKGNSQTTSLTLETQDFKVKAESGVKFAVTSPDSLYVLQGELEADILDGTKTIKTVKVGIGQQLVLTDSAISDLSKGLEKELIFATDADFKASSWYVWNEQKDGGSIVEEDPTDTKDDKTTDDDKTTTEDDKKTEDDDKTATDGPDTPQITSPAENGEEFTLTKVDQFISGTVSDDTEKVIVNEYTLNQYTPGSGKFTYKASAATIKNLKVGSNLFTVTAVDKEGNKSKAATITLILPQKVFDAAGLKDDEASTKDEAATSTGGVTITSPNGGKNLVTNETSFVISGTVPSKTSKVKVNGYQLQAFTLGNTSFKYNANTGVGTLKAGQKNTFEVIAYDATENQLGSASITIDLSSDSESTPAENAPTPSGNLSLSISLPTTASAYETTLNQISLGGTVSGSPDAIYVNNSKLESYAPGSDKWSMQVTLNPGANVFSVYGEKEGQTTPADTITVTYKNQ